ncbi:MAG: cell division protein FtsZ [Euryarchaeota archaeon]|nr:cell division protein FtsZ [Euryarchaeota archaeon]
MGWDYLINEALSESPRKVGGLKVKVVGVGGGGCNSIDRLSKMNLDAELIAINTDRRQIMSIDAHKRVIIGEDMTYGRGAGGSVELGERVASASMDAVSGILEDADMIFILSTLGGGTGSGAGPVIAQLARKTRALVVSIVTMPFKAEGKRRWENATLALEKFRKVSNTVIVLDNNKLLKLVPKLPLKKAFMIMDVLVADLISSVVDVVNNPSLINVDFSDIDTLMRHGGTSTVLYGDGDYYTPQDAVVDTLNNPLMDIDYRGATGALIHITGGPNMTLRTVYKISEGIVSGLSEDAEVKIGARVDDRFRNKLKITTILTGVHTPFVTEQRATVSSMGISSFIPVIY